MAPQEEDENAVSQMTALVITLNFSILQVFWSIWLHMIDILRFVA